MKYCTAFLLLLGTWYSALGQARVPAVVKIQGIILHTKSRYLLIESSPVEISRRRDTLWIKPDGRFSVELTNWPQLRKVTLIGADFLLQQWLAPGFDLTYTLIGATTASTHDESAEALRAKFMAERHQLVVTGYGSELNQYEIDDTVQIEYPLLTKDKQPDQKALRVRARRDSLWQAHFPRETRARLRKKIPVFAEFMRIKERELLFSYFHNRSLMRYTDTADYNRLLFTPQMHKLLSTPEIVKCYECILSAENYAYIKLRRESGAYANYKPTYTQMIPEFSKLYPAPLVAYLNQDILKEIVYNYEYEASPSFSEIVALVEQYFPVAEQPAKARLLSRLNEVAARKKSVRGSFAAGSKAPVFQVTDSLGAAHSLEELAGKVVYIDFWASWCSPCRADMPAMKQLQARFKDNPMVVFVNVAVHDKEKNWKRALWEEAPAGRSWWDKTGAVAKAYHASYIPRYVLIGKNGELLDAYEPGPRLSEANAQLAIERALLAEIKTK